MGKASKFGILATVVLILIWLIAAQNNGLIFAEIPPGEAAQSDTDTDKGFSNFGPYTGVSVKGVDVTTLDGKVLCGYQGWFGVPGDGSADGNWRHWTKGGGPMTDGNAKVDLWPDVSELSPGERFATGFKLANGGTAEVYSSYEKPTVLRHFQWMRDYNIDGVFVQRFVTGVHDYNNLEYDNTVLANCRAGANLFGRTYAVMYDLSGLTPGRVETVMNDWRQLRKQMAITDDPAYLHHHGKPVVAIWGIGFNDGRDYSLDDCRKLIDFFKNDPQAGGCTVMVGVPAYWHELDHDAIKDPALIDVLKEADVISPWTVGRYTNPQEADVYINNIVKADAKWCAQNKIDYLPVVFPGFSWYNMYGSKYNFVPRLRGQFLWSQFQDLDHVGAKMVYVAMFDEMDEGTAIFKCSDDPPVGQKSKFLTYEGLPSDYYLKIVGEGKKLIQNKLQVPTPEVASIIPANLNNPLVRNTNNIDSNGGF